jgi:SOS response regulatory protein OraA/RecX
LIDKMSNKSRYQNKQKLIQYLISKGFSYTDIKDNLNS